MSRVAAFLFTRFGLGTWRVGRGQTDIKSKMDWRRVEEYDSCKPHTHSPHFNAVDGHGGVSSGAHDRYRSFLYEGETRRIGFQ